MAEIVSGALGVFDVLGLWLTPKPEPEPVSLCEIFQNLELVKQRLAAEEKRQELWKKIQKQKERNEENMKAENADRDSEWEIVPKENKHPDDIIVLGNLSQKEKEELDSHGIPYY